MGEQSKIDGEKNEAVEKSEEKAYLDKYVSIELQSLGDLLNRLDNGHVEDNLLYCRDRRIGDLESAGMLEIIGEKWSRVYIDHKLSVYRLSEGGKQLAKLIEEEIETRGGINPQKKR